MKIKPSKTLKPPNQQVNTPIYTEILNMRNVRRSDFSKNKTRANFFSKNKTRANFFSKNKIRVNFVDILFLVLLILLAFQLKSIVPSNDNDNPRKLPNLQPFNQPQLPLSQPKRTNKPKQVSKTATSAKVTPVNINIENNVAIKDFVQQNQDTSSTQLKSN
jgi:hypothetical protein